MTTGGSTRETIEVAKAAGGEVVGTASIVDRSRAARSASTCRSRRCSRSRCRPTNPTAVRCARRAWPVVKPGSRQADGIAESGIAELQKGKGTVPCTFLSAILPSCNSAMTTFKIIVAYDGTGYVGWQRQANGVSIQALIEDALRELDGRDVAVPAPGAPMPASTRSAQVAAFTIARELSPTRSSARSMPSCRRDPRAVRRGSAAGIPPALRRDDKDLSLSDLERRRHEPVRTRLRVARARPAGRRGDVRRGAAARRARTTSRRFRRHGSDVATTEREILSRSAAISRSMHSAGSLILRGHRPGFLRHMVRTIVGIARGGRAADGGRSSGSPTCSRRAIGRAAGPTAPPHGLFLVGVEYPVRLRMVLKACTLDGLLTKEP